MTFNLTTGGVVAAEAVTPSRRPPTLRLRHAIVAALVMQAASGCVTAAKPHNDPLRSAPPAPNRALPDPVAASPSPESAADGPAAAVNPFDGATELQLDALRAQVLRRNPTLMAMRNAFRAAMARYPQAIALDDPMFSYGLGPATIDSDRVDLGQTFDVSQALPWPGKLRLRGEAALSAAGAAEADVEATRLQLVELTDHAFYDYYFVDRAIDINRTNQGLLVDFARIAAARYAAGLGAKQDALQAEVERQHLVHRGIVLERTRAVTTQRLNTLLNLPPDDHLPPPPQTLSGVASLQPAGMLEAAALQHRPQLRALRLRVQQRTAEVQLARREFFPNFTVRGAYNSLWQEDALRPLVGVGINVPLQLGRRQAALDEARAREQQARAELEEERARVRFEVTSAAEEVRESTHAVQLFATAIIPASEDSLAAARSDYEAGTNDFLTLINAEKGLMLARLSYHQALTDYHQRRARLERAVGVPLETVQELP